MPSLPGNAKLPMDDSLLSSLDTCHSSLVTNHCLHPCTIKITDRAAAFRSFAIS
jgi:hypothetical protein